MKKYINKYLDQLQELMKLQSGKLRSAKIKNVIISINTQAKQGDKEAIVAFCYLQITGFSIEKNLVAAKERLNKMINKQRSHEAMFFVAIAYYYGELDYPIDKAKSEPWLREVVITDNPELSVEKRRVAAKLIAEMYRSGDPVVKDDAEAYRFYSVAAELGCVESSRLVGEMHLLGTEGVFGSVVDKDPSAGLDILIKLSEKGDEEASEVLLRHYIKSSLNLCRSSNLDSELITEAKQSLSKLEWLI